MALADEIRALRDRAMHDLTSAHDYYTDTKIAWRLVQKVVQAGHTFKVRNLTTGTAATQNDIAAKSRAYVADQLTAATFQQFISIFEVFLFDLLRLWLSAYPQSLVGKTVEFKDVLDAPDTQTITVLVIDKELNEISYRRPAAWFEYLNARVKLHCPSAAEIEQVSEAKATRDVLAHNRGLASKAYVSKAGPRARFREGERIEIPEHYHRDTWQLLRKVIGDICDAAMTKVT
jgi:hypothetical protein